jgi:hypothetical protein
LFRNPAGRPHRQLQSGVSLCLPKLDTTLLKEFTEPV